MMRYKPATILKYFKYWPPFLASGISVKEFDLDAGYVVSQMKLSPWNTNYFGTMYGGSLFSMCDPFFVFIVAHQLGRDYYIWDIESHIKYIKATKKKVTARFEISKEQITDLRQQASTGEKVTPTYYVQIFDSDGELIAEVSKTIYVKKKKPKADLKS